jgi:hypothetical protein
MSQIENLVKAYEQRVARDWSGQAAGPERIWIALYEPRDERRLRTQLTAFELATTGAGHPWVAHDLTDAFATWMAAQEYQEAYFEAPEDLELALDGFAAHVAQGVLEKLQNADDRAVVALFGIGSLFGLTRVSRLLETVESKVRGRLLLFFPGEHEAGNLRLLDARDGWNYLAVIIRA